MPGSNRCRWCHAYLLWARTSAGGVMPVDWKKHPDGDVVLSFEPGTDKPLAIILGPHDLLSTTGRSMPRHRSHLTTCPQADQWKARRR